MIRLDTDIYWFRLGATGPGLQLKGPRHRPLFSERYGHRKPILNLCGYRLFYLKPWNPVP